MKYNKKIICTSSYIEIWEYQKAIFTNRKHKESANESEPRKRRTFEELTEKEQRKRLQRMKQTRLNAKWKLLRLVDCNFNDNTSFLTLTTKENIQDRNKFKNLLKTFIKRFNYNIFQTKKNQLKYIAVLEKQKRGAWHAHILLFDVPYIPHNQLLKLWGHGAVRINNLKQPIINTNYVPFDYKFSNEEIVYESEYNSKIYIGGEYIDNNVKYKKIKLNIKE